MPKKTLNEATVRQFMKLVNHKPATISNFISENYKEEKELEEGYSEGHGDEKHEAMDEGVYEEEEAMKEMAPAMEAEDEDADPVDDMPEPMDDEPAGKSGEVDITPEIAAAVIELGDMLKGAMPEMAGDEDDMGDEPDDLPEPPPAGDEPPAGDDPAMMEAEDANEEMNEEEMIQEVARRVAARILKAKNAKKELDEALGNK